MNEWQKQKEILLDEINEACRQPFLNKIIGAPHINPHRIAALLLAYPPEERSTFQVRKQITAAILIQLALETHNLIPPITDEVSREHQLIVLAGDYYSGMYYQTLAEAGCVQWVGVLAEAVKKVNEAKTLLHQYTNLRPESVFHLACTIEGEIIGAVYEEVQSQKAVWPAMQLLLLISRLESEKKKPFMLMRALDHALEERQASLAAVNDKINALRGELSEQVKSMDSSSADVIQAEWNLMFNEPLRLVEEG